MILDSSTLQPSRVTARDRKTRPRPDIWPRHTLDQPIRSQDDPEARSCFSTCSTMRARPSAGNSPSLGYRHSDHRGRPAQHPERRGKRHALPPARPRCGWEAASAQPWLSRRSTNGVDDDTAVDTTESCGDPALTGSIHAFNGAASRHDRDAEETSHFPQHEHPAAILTRTPADPVDCPHRTLARAHGADPRTP
jgi:hypothetical protein